MINATRNRLSAEIGRQTQLSRDIAQMQTQISTQKRILAPSDDPTASARISEIGRSQADQVAYSRNLDIAAAQADRADTALSSVSIAVDRARELMLSASSGTTSAEERRITASELRGLAEQITALSQTKDSRGADLFRVGDPLQIPVAAGITVAAVASREEVFEAVPTVDGPQSFVDILNSAAAGLEEPDATLRQAATDASLVKLKAAVEHVATVAGEQGVRATRIDSMQDRAVDTKLQLNQERVGLEAVNVPEVVARLQATTLSLEAAQAVFARVNQNTLFDLLR